MQACRNIVYYFSYFRQVRECISIIVFFSRSEPVSQIIVRPVRAKDRMIND
jgi:hypothetical protein